MYLYDVFNSGFQVTGSVKVYTSVPVNNTQYKFKNFHVPVVSKCLAVVGKECEID